MAAASQDVEMQDIADGLQKTYIEERPGLGTLRVVGPHRMTILEQISRKTEGHFANINCIASRRDRAFCNVRIHKRRPHTGQCATIHDYERVCNHLIVTFQSDMYQSRCRVLRLLHSASFRSNHEPAGAVLW